MVLLFFLVYRYQIRRIDKRNREKLEKQKIQTDLFESELKALRSQMNPHFIFNSLNSIQDLILQKDTNASYDYIVLFADLVRNTLNYSNKDFIPIEKELEFLEVYLSLEKLRFEEDFNYEVSFKGSKDVNVPSLIVQPFIENALVHGLLHQSGQKKLTIEFEYSQKLTCTVTDNGVGRKRAKEIQERRGNLHESFALDAIKKRLSIMSEQHGEEVGYTVFDLFDEDTPSGTKVVITMPFQDQF
jgi:LytS/YehU family sensor histidine kinase